MIYAPPPPVQLAAAIERIDRTNGFRSRVSCKANGGFAGNIELFRCFDDFGRRSLAGYRCFYAEFTLAGREVVIWTPPIPQLCPKRKAAPSA